MVDLNVDTAVDDKRELEVVAAGLRCFKGRQLVVDVTVRSVLTASGEARPRTHWNDGVVADGARADNERSYPELARGARCHLVVLAIESGGRVSSETSVLSELTRSRADSLPSHLRATAVGAFVRRWSRVLSIAVASTIASSLVHSKSEMACWSGHGFANPWVQDVMADGRQDFPLGPAA